MIESGRREWVLIFSGKSALLTYGSIEERPWSYYFSFAARPQFIENVAADFYQGNELPAHVARGLSQTAPSHNEYALIRSENFNRPSHVVDSACKNYYKLLQGGFSWGNITVNIIKLNNLFLKFPGEENREVPWCPFSTNSATYIGAEASQYQRV